MENDGFLHTHRDTKERERGGISPPFFRPSLGGAFDAFIALIPSLSRAKEEEEEEERGRTSLTFPTKGRAKKASSSPSFCGKKPFYPHLSGRGRTQSVGRRVKERRTRDDFVHQRHAAEKICFPHWQDRRSTSIIPPLPTQRRKTASIFPGPLASPHEIGG